MLRQSNMNSHMMSAERLALRFAIIVACGIHGAASMPNAKDDGLLLTNTLNQAGASSHEAHPAGLTS